MTTERIDTLLSARWVIPVEPAGATLPDSSVAIRDGKIVAVLPTREALNRFDPTEQQVLTDHILMPGLVNLHTHAAMTLMRGLADDLPLMAWLSKHIWPAEARHVSDAFVHDGTLLACSEMLRGGITTFNDMYFYPGASARAAIHAGMRASVGIIAIEFPTAYASDPDDYLSKGLATRDELRENDLISFCLAPHAPYTVSDRTFGRIRVMADELDLPVHVHLHETRDEIQGGVRDHGRRPISRLQDLGLVGPRLIAVHAVHLEESELQLLASSGASVAHCPSSNLKLSSGIARTARMLDLKINVGLGTDGAASNNRLDMFQEMRTAALLAKVHEGTAESVSAHTAIRMATLNGATALGLESAIGSLLPGKKADLCAISLTGPEMTPCYDPASHLVYAAGREQVTDVWVGGRHVLAERKPLQIDTVDLDNRIRLWQNKIGSETLT